MPSKEFKFLSNELQPLVLNDAGRAALLALGSAAPSTQNLEPETAAIPDGHGLLLDRDSHVAEAASSEVPLDLQNTLLSAIEARLTDEMLRLIEPLDQFGRRAQLISKEIPESAQFCKLVTISLGLLGFQLAYAIRKSCDTPVFLNDGREYLAKLGLELHEFVREVDLDGRRFWRSRSLTSKALSSTAPLARGNSAR